MEPRRFEAPKGAFLCFRSFEAPFGAKKRGGTGQKSRFLAYLHASERGLEAHAHVGVGRGRMSAGGRAGRGEPARVHVGRFERGRARAGSMSLLLPFFV